MKKLITLKTIIYISAGIHLFACSKEDLLPNYETQVICQIQTEKNTPVSGCTVMIVHDYAEKTKDAIKYAKSDKNGKAVTSARSRPSLIIRSQHQNYYPTYEGNVSNISHPQDYTYTPLKKLHHVITLRKIIKPIPLFAKCNNMPFPAINTWIGFDLEKADWVNPYGIGSKSDVEFHLTNMHLEAETINGQSGLSRIEEIKKMHKSHPRNKQVFLDSRDDFFNLKKGTSSYEQSIVFRMHPWIGTVKMRVPHPNGGIIAEKERYLIYSKNPRSDYPNDFAPEMRMPHHAPIAGYGAEFQWEKKSGEQSLIDEKLGFFIKTRVKLDEQGNEISAHYAKFITDVEIDIRGRIKFTSYFNPTPNDTNLEFDLKKNLFKDLKDEEKPFLP